MSEGTSCHRSKADVSEAGVSSHGRHDRTAACLRFANHFCGNTRWLVANNINFFFQFDTQGLSHERIKNFGGTVAGDT